MNQATSDDTWKNSSANDNGPLTNMLCELIAIAKDDSPILERMFQYYLHDMSEYAGWPLSVDGTFTYPDDLLPPYWETPDHHPYFIVCDEEVAGFCLIRRSPNDPEIWDMGQFFVLRKFRGRDVGGSAFEQVLLMHSGRWQVRVLVENKPAYHFWKTRIDRVSQGEFHEVIKPYKHLQMTFFNFETER